MTNESYLSEDNDQGKVTPDIIYSGAKAILPFLKQWLEKDEETLDKQAISSNAEVYKKLKREFEIQEKLRRDEEGKDGKKKSGKKSKKKKRADSEEDDDYRPVKLKISRK